MMTIVLALFFYITVRADTLEAKRIALINLFQESLPEVQKISSTLPADLQLASRAVKSTDKKEKASLFYEAAHIALLKAKDELNSLSSCKAILERANAESKNWQELNCENAADPLRNSFCLNRTSDCRTNIHDFKIRLEQALAYNKKLTSSKFQPDALMEVDSMNFGRYARSYVDANKDNCAVGSRSKKIHAELDDACRPLIKLTEDDIIEDTKLKAKVIKEEVINGIKTTSFDNPTINCRETTPHPRAPLYLAGGGRNMKGYFCEGSTLVGLQKGDVEILLINSRVRSFYWLQMAEYYSSGQESKRSTDEILKREIKTIINQNNLQFNFDLFF